MVYITDNQEEWVAFAEDDDVGGPVGFEEVVSEPFRIKPKPGDSARRHKDTSSVNSWMKKPIASDSSWAPVAPPESREPSSATQSRPPRNPASSPRSKPVVSSSDSSTASDHRRYRGNAVSHPSPSASRRGRSSSKPRNDYNGGMPTQQTRSSSRARSSSRSRPHSRSGRQRSRSRSNSIQRRSSSRSLNGAQPRSSASRHRSRSASSRSSRTGMPPVGSRSPAAVKPRSLARTTSNRPPPSTSRTRGLVQSRVSSSNSVGPGVPRHKPPSPSNASQATVDDNASMRSLDANIGRDIFFGRTRSGKPANANASTSKRSGFLEKLFGDQVSEEAKQAYLPKQDASPRNSAGSVGGASALTFNQPELIHSRILLTATVYHNTATNLWIATINTNQKGVSKNPATASKYLKAFSFASEQEARESAIANAPPKMLPFADHPTCFICNGKFAMFRRASHCRNCGVCVCNSCSMMWSSKMIPDTYNLKKEAHVKICKSCNFVTGAFKKALLEGDYEEAIALYGSGNLNLRVPFHQTSKNDELMHQIHCAVQGGNLDVVRWLMEDHFCPIKMIRTGKQKKGGGADLLIKTSKDRTVLSIALSALHVDILRYLVVDCGVSIYEAKDLKSSLRALEAVLLVLPGPDGAIRHDMTIHRWDDTSFDGGMSTASSLGADQSRASFSSKRNNSEACILCCDNAIDCVMTPCGHQHCCLQCATNLTACPVCNVKGNFIKIFRP